MLDADFIVFITITSLCIVCGAVGNGLVIVVFVTKKHRFPKRMYILTLAVVDLVVMTLIAPYSIVFELRLVGDPFVCHTFEIIRHTLIAYSNLVLILIASERFLLVWRPLKIMSSKAKLACIIGFLIFSIICSSPSAAIYNVSDHNAQPSENATQTSPEYCAFTTSILGNSGSDIYLKFVTLSVFLELFILIATYVFIYVWIYRQRKKLTGVFVGSISKKKSSVKSNTSKANKKDFDNIVIADCRCTGEQVGFESEINSITLVHDTVQHPKHEPNLHQGRELTNVHSDDCTRDTSASDKHNKYSQEFKLNKPQSSSQESGGNGVCSVAIASGSNNTSGESSTQTCSTSGKRLSTAKKRSNVDTKTWTMLSICTVIYIICWIPFSIHLLGVYKSLVCKYFFFIGQATNPIIYSIVNVKVRQEIKNLFFGRTVPGMIRSSHTTPSFILSSVTN